MPIFSGSCQGIRQLEEVVRNTGTADCLSDGEQPFEAFGENNHKSAEYSRLYELYLKKGIARWECPTVMVRFEYDERNNSAKAKISRRDMNDLIQFMPGLLGNLSAIGQISDNAAEPSAVRRADELLGQLRPES